MYLPLAPVLRDAVVTVYVAVCFEEGVYPKIDYPLKILLAAKGAEDLVGATRAAP
jgi:hypothetical protein